MLLSLPRRFPFTRFLFVGLFSILGVGAHAASATVSFGQPVTLSSSVDGTAPFAYQWYKDGAILSGATTGSYVISSFQSADVGVYTVAVSNSLGSATSPGATLSSTAVITTGPVFILQPVGQTVSAGAPVTFTATASGVPTPTYQWKKSGVDIAGATNSSYSIASPVTGNAGSYTVVATNSAGTATSSAATLTVNAINSAPAFILQPISQSSPTGTSVTFTAAASGLPAPTYRWRKNGTNISGATGSSYTISSVSSSSAATYTVVATNSLGSATSTGAVLTVTATAIAPAITSQPVSQVVALGAVVNLSVGVSGSPLPAIQWKKNGVDIVGANSALYTITSVATTNVATYTVVATNSAGSVTSNAVTLTINGLTVPTGFDVQGYLSRYPDVQAVYANDPLGAWVHYRDYGIYQGEVFDENFRVEEYLGLYPELFAVYGSNLSGALMHWLTVGQLEGRVGRIPVGFSSAGYFARNPDVAAAVNNDPILAWDHFWKYGIYEGRSYDEELRVFEYLAINTDLQPAFLNDWRGALMHWLRYGRTEGRLGRIPLMFDSTVYLAHYPDVAVSWGTNPTTVWQHFWLYGIDEGRVFDDVFRVDEYLQMYPDLAAKFGPDRRSAFMHWVRYGQAEGRLGRLP